VPGFDLDTTIFGSISGALPRTVQKSKIAIELFWSDSAVSRVDKMYEIVPSPPSYKKGLMDFMQVSIEEGWSEATATLRSGAADILQID